jgi:uncharacterized protein YbjT (DUF2867 family)
MRIIGLNMFLITGASGRVARRAAELLAQRGFGLRLMTRTPQRAPKLEGVEVVRGDFAEPATLDDAFAGVSNALVVSGSGNQANARDCTRMRSKQRRGRALGTSFICRSRAPLRVRCTPILAITI